MNLFTAKLALHDIHLPKTEQKSPVKRDFKTYLMLFTSHVCRLTFDVSRFYSLVTI